ncbi:hypothetical protein MMC13_006328 [Lambiella insularis]|nr:hypothetical protein [Lambiella insularis]
MDPTAPLSPFAIQRVLFLSPSVHVYRIPPLTSTKGHLAAGWTLPPVHQFPPCRLRIVETADPPPDPSSNPPTSKAPPSFSPDALHIALLLEDPSSGALFAACPYTSPASVDAALDSSRFFALRVVGEGGRTAVLGIGFEERAEAFDFGVALQQVRKILNLDTASERVPGRAQGQSGGKVENVPPPPYAKGRDWSLKEGESIYVDLGRRARGGREGKAVGGGIAPPSAGMGGGFLPLPLPLPPPPSAKEVREERRREVKEGGFDDGEFGEYQ